MTEPVARLLWLIPTTLLVGFIYAVIRSDDMRGWLRQGVRQWLYILFGMCALGLVIYWLAQTL